MTGIGLAADVLLARLIGCTIGPRDDLKLRCNDMESTQTLRRSVPHAFRTAMHDMKHTHFLVFVVLTTLALNQARSAEPMLVAGGEAATHTLATNGTPGQYPHDLISVEQRRRLEKIRDSIGSIRNLDSLYQNRTHPNGLPYHLYVPATLQTGTKYPLVIFLHGHSDVTLNTHKGFPKGIWSLPHVQTKHPHILFVPRFRTEDDAWVHDDYRKMVMKALDDLLREFNHVSNKPRIDVNRVYLTGFSMGGMGAWDYLKHEPDRFAAVCPLSGFSSARRMRWKRKPYGTFRFGSSTATETMGWAVLGSVTKC